MLYETAARGGEILALNVEDLDLARKRAVIIGKGGHREHVFWASGAARLLSRYLAGRRRGPVFLTHRRPNVIPARGDECPHTSRGRLSYERASTIFKQATGGWTLHQLRHSSLTHLGEQGASTILLQAKSRHQDPAPSPYTPNRETKQSRNSRPHLTNNGRFDDQSLPNSPLSTSCRG